MMRICFVQESPLEETPVICELSAMMKKHGFETYLVIDKLEKDVILRIRNFDPDIIAVQCEIFAEKWVNSMIEKLLRNFPSRKIILFGSLPTFFPEKIRRSENIILAIGEPEKAFLEIIGADGSELYDDIEADWDIYYRTYSFLGDFPVKRVLISRGCLLQCSFCYIYPMRKNFGGKMRLKSPQRVIREISLLKEKYVTKFIHFSDDLFPVWNKAWLEEFSDLWQKEIKLPYSIITLANHIDARVVKLLKNSGCRMVMIGVETYNEKTRVDLLGKKGVTDRAIFRCVDELKKSGIYVGAFCMIGIHGETQEDWFKTIDFLRKIKIDFPYPTVFLPIPGTPLGDIVLKNKEKSNGKRTNEKEMILENIFFLCLKSPLISDIANFLFKKGVFLPLKILIPINSIFVFLRLKKIYFLGFYDCLKFFIFSGDIRKRKAVLHWVG